MKQFIFILSFLLFALAGYSQSVQIQDGAILATFSVSDSTKVYFSQGNLQYQASTKTWRFAEHQYDMIGNDNKNISSSYSGYIDLFGWGTSGWAESGANAYQPYSTSTSSSDYYVGGSYTNSLTGSYANADWGVYNKISNGGNQVGMWRTLTQSEWYYLMYSRPHADRLYSQGRVDGVNGLVLLPDNWTTPSSIQFTYQAGDWSTNSYSVDDWNVMQSYGAVFLPASGYRNGTAMNFVGSYGYYWSSSYYDSARYGYYWSSSYYDSARYAYYLFFESSNFSTSNSSNRYGGFSVRVVRDVK